MGDISRPDCNNGKDDGGEVSDKLDINGRLISDIVDMIVTGLPIHSDQMV